jgi:hypothetical protein
MSELVSGLVLLGAYVVLVILARWICIARTNMLWTRAQAKAITRRLSMLDGRGCPENGQAPVTPLCLQPLLDDIKNNDSVRERRDIFGWNGSRQIAQWVTMHEAERLALPALGHEQLVARLERARGQLAELPQPRREAWDYVICTLLARKDEPDRKRLDRDYRAYLDELLGEIYEASNGNAVQLSGLYNRATWIILVSLLPLAVLAGFGFGMLLVAGAIGGLISRIHTYPRHLRQLVGPAVLRAGPWRAGGLGRAGPHIAAADGGRAEARRPADLSGRPAGAIRRGAGRSDPAGRVGAVPPAAGEAGRGRHRPGPRRARGPGRNGSHHNGRPAGAGAPDGRFADDRGGQRRGGQRGRDSQRGRGED